MAKRGYAIIIKNLNYSPTDAAITYFWMTSNSVTGQSRVNVPISGKIKRIDCVFCTTGTIGSNEQGSLYLNKNGVSNETLLSNTVKVDAVNNSYSITGLNIDVTTSDYLNIQFTAPTRVTNPTSVNFCAFIWIE